jgi:RNA polymerase sigma-70 factor, ECF subfamily
MSTNKQHIPDSKLAEEFITNRDQASFTEIYNRYFDNVYNFVYSRVGNETWTQDIVSETFYTLIEVLKSYSSKSNLKSFIIGISANKIKQFWQKKYKQNESSLDDSMIYIDEEDYDEKYESKISGYLDQVLQELKEKYRNVLTCRFIKEKSIKETAEELGFSEANVRVIQNRALKKAAQIAQKYLPTKPTNTHEK